MIHHVYANRSNVGDVLSAQGIQSFLPAGSLAEHRCDEPFVTETLARLEGADRDDLVVIGGGGLFMDYFVPFWEGFACLAPRFPFVVWGAGYVDLKREASRAPGEILRPVLAQARVCVVRDELTRDLLDLSHPPAVVPCPSILAVPRRAPEGRGILHVASYSTTGAAAYDRMCDAATAFGARTDRPYRETNNEMASERRTLAEILDLYARSDVILSGRLHGCIIAHAMGRPVVAVSGDRKIESFMAAAGLSHRVLDADEVERLPDLLEAAAGDTPDPSRFLELAMRENRAVARRVQSLLDGKSARSAAPASGVAS